MTALGEDTDTATAYQDPTEGRRLIVPEHIGVSYGWIVQAQHMIERGEWRVRHIDYENAPFGRSVGSASPYRWWLSSLGWVDHLVTGAPAGRAVERAALYSGLLMQFLFAAVCTVMVARRFGGFAASLVAVGTVTVFPFAASFVPGAPDENELIRVTVAVSMLLLLRGVDSLRAGPRAVAPIEAFPKSPVVSQKWWFFASGVAGGIAMWMSVAVQMPLVAGITVGGLFAAWQARASGNDTAKVWIEGWAWRAWGLGGASVVWLAYLIDGYHQGMVAFELRSIHPLYGIAWLGCSELVARGGALLYRQSASRSLARDVAAIVVAVAAVASVPVVMGLTGTTGFFAIDLLSFRLTNQPDGVIAPNLAVWLRQDSLSLAVWSTFLPLILLATIVWLICRPRTQGVLKLALVVMVGPLMVALTLACLHLRWWQTVDGLLLVALGPVACAVTQTFSIRGRVAWVTAVIAAFGLGAGQLFPARDRTGQFVVTVPEVEGLIERDLARSLGKRVDPVNSPVVLAPPSVTNALYYYGGLRGVATLARENKDGLSAALRIMLSNSHDEARELVRGREIGLIVIPSWAPVFDGYVEAASVQTGELFFTSLRRWAQPTWLRPISHMLPTIPGFDGQSVQIFEVRNDQRDALALCRMVAYFAEMGQTANLRAAAEALKQYPMDFGAQITRVEVAGVLGDQAQLSTQVDGLVARLTARADRGLAWDRRISLAVVLARAQRRDLARQQVARCLGEVTAERLRSLTPSALYHLLALSKAFGVEMDNAQMRHLALDLLPPELRSRF